MRTSCLSVLFFICAVFPFSASAEIIINEIAWMGTDVGGANCEWIELRNTESSVVDLSAWTLTIENAGTGAPKVLVLNDAASVKYSGIAENGYYLLARDSGACKDLSPHTSADWLGSFGTGISNSGSKLTLKEGSEERDVVDVKTGWETSKGGVGGKNTAPKETPQYTGSSWITASPTPRGPNHLAPLEELPEEEEEETPPVVTVGGTAPLVPVTHPVPELYVDGGPARIVLAGADTAFSAIAYDSVGTVRKNATITWSFGDSGQEKGEEVTHAYKKPGKYTAVVRARDKGVSAIALIPVVVTESRVAISSVSDEGITLTNESEALADLSGWKIAVGSKTVRLPADTVLTGGGATFLPFETLRVASGTEPSLQFPNGRLAYAYEKPSKESEELQQVQAVEPVRELAITSPRHEELVAPVAHEPRVAAGAPVFSTSNDQTVILEEKGLMEGVGSFMASVLGSVTGIFSR